MVEVGVVGLIVAEVVGIILPVGPDILYIARRVLEKVNQLVARWITELSHHTKGREINCITKMVVSRAS